MSELIEIDSGALSAAINPLGAELTHLRDAEGRELMTDADPAFWTGHAPILFPIVGAVNDDNYRIDGRAYHLERHGFARRSRFDCVEHAGDRARFRLTDSEATRAIYPFAFALEIAFAIDGATLSVTAAIENPGADPLPASFGFHPAFAWPLPYGRDRGDHRITFGSDEPGGLRELTPAGLVMPGERNPPLDGRVLPLADDLFTDDALIWDPVASDHVRYGAGDGPSLVVRFPDTPRLGVWTKPGAHYVCIEPWHGIADPVGFAGDYRDKPGVFEVAPGANKRIEMSVTLVP
ncbi:aldose 1-epimerase family protein [Sphingomonas koreensis]|nr:aldose 1-epimerase family protein [Sphingomonas koreensis]